MGLNERWQAFIDMTARKPFGDLGLRLYNNPTSHYRSFRIILDKLKLTPDDRYMEIGCGGGILLKTALELVRYGAAIDHSPDMVQLAEDNNRVVVREGRAEIVQGDAASLPWAGESFTACASANMFFYVEEPRQVLSEIVRILEPGGRFAMVTTARSFLLKITFGWLYELRTYTDREMRSMLEEAGFSRVEVRSRWGYDQICFAVK